MESWNLCSYLGLVCATLYRIPQIAKIRRSKRASDLSLRSYGIQLCAYVSFLAYLTGTSKLQTEWVLCLYNL